MGDREEKPVSGCPCMAGGFRVGTGDNWEKNPEFCGQHVRPQSGGFKASYGLLTCCTGRCISARHLFRLGRCWMGGKML